MATMPQIEERQLSKEEATSELYRLLEDHFDEMGLSEEERDKRYSRGERRVIELDAAVSKS